MQIYFGINYQIQKLEEKGAQNLQGWECKNAVSYIVYGMRVAE